MTRITSTATSITVQSSQSALSAAAAAAPSGRFTVFHGNDLSTRSTYTATTSRGTTSYACNVTEDGGGDGHTAIDWASKGCYDDLTKRVMWASTGAGLGYAGGYVYNTHTIFDETAAFNGVPSAGKWSATRGFRSPNATKTTALVHLYDSLCIDVRGRRFYKQMFGENLIFVFNLDTNQWVDGIVGAPQDDFLRTGALEFIPTRGANGALWCYGEVNGIQRLWEKQLPNGEWTQIAGDHFGPQTNSFRPMSFNPRSRMVFCGGENNVAYIVDPTTLSVTTTTHPTGGSFSSAHGSHLCKDPTGDGWLYAASAVSAPLGGKLFRCSSSGTWTVAANLPPELPAGTVHPFIMVPIDAYGVLWLVRGSSTGGSPAAWLYKP